MTESPPHVQLTCRSCLDEWSVHVSEKSLALTVATHSRVDHDGERFAYLVEPDEDEEAEVAS